ncbi:MAG: hypothetical protein R3F55_12445 [Alphaproteobacteria bacterium]
MAADGGVCAGRARIAAAIARGSRAEALASIRTMPSRCARSARRNCSIRGRVRGTSTAGLSNESTSQKVLYPPIPTMPTGAVDQRLDARVEGDRLEAVQPGDALLEPGAQVRLHERAQHEYRLRRVRSGSAS